MMYFKLSALLFLFTACSLSEEPFNLLPNSYFLKTRNFLGQTGSEMKVLHYIPDKPDSLGVVLWHGGGWSSGDIQAMHDYCDFYASRGVHCLVPEYHLVKDSTTTPLQSREDAFLFWQTLQQESTHWGVDSLSWWTGGSSAGGILGAWIPSRGKILISPVLKTLGEGSYSNATLSPQAADSLDVISQLGAQILWAPTIIFHGLKDRTVLPIGSQEYCQSHQKEGVECNMIEFYTKDHRSILEADSKAIIKNTSLSFMRSQP